MLERLTGASSNPSSAWFSSSSWNARFRTRTVNTTAERIAVRERNSTSRSLRARRQACRNTSATGHGPPVGVGDLGGPAPAAGRELHEPASMHERDVGRELRSFLDVVRDEHGDAPLGRLLGEEPAELF